MLSTIGSIVVTLVSFVVTAVVVVIGYAIALIPQLLNLATETFLTIKNLFA